MKAFDSICELRNGKRYSTARTTKLNEYNGPEGNSAGNSHATGKNEEAEFRTSTREKLMSTLRASLRHSQDS